MQSSESTFIIEIMRIKFLLIAMLTLGVIYGQDSKPASPKPTVVFVCEHGSAKSVIAAMEFQRMVKQSELEVNVLTRGTNPDADIPKLVRDGLRADGLDVGTLKPTKLSEKDLAGAIKIVSFGPDLKPWLPTGATVTDWSAGPSVNTDYHAAQEYIKKQLELLIKDLKK
jgi:protein-tyrosine-phosphatase